MIPNRVTLDEFAKLAPRDAESLPLDQLALIYGDADTLRATLKAVDAKLHTVMSGRFSARAADARRADGKDTGVAHIDDGDFIVTVNQPKTVDWDQEHLADMVSVIRDDWKQDPAEFIKVKYAVDERCYTAWPTPLRVHFESARTVKPGKLTFEITPRTERRAAA